MRKAGKASHVGQMDSESVEAYIASYPESTQAILRRLRALVFQIEAEASERISYRIPCFEYRGVLVYFAAFKHHIGLYPTSEGVDFFEERLKNYKTSRGAIQFPLDQELPYSLIEEIIRHRVQHNRGAD